MYSNASITKIKSSIFYFPLLASIIIWGLYYVIDLNFQPGLSFQNAIYLSFACTVFFFAIQLRNKNIIDLFIVLALFLAVITGPLKSMYYQYVFYESLNLLIVLVQLALIMISSCRIMKWSYWFILPVLLIITLLKIGGSLSFYVLPAEYLLRYDQAGNKVFNFFNIEYYLNCSFQSLAALVILLILFNHLFFKVRRTVPTPRRNMMQLGGFFVFFLISLTEVLFMASGYQSPWVHSLLEIFGIVLFLIWFIALRSREDHDPQEERHILWGVHLSLWFPIFYFLIRFQNSETILVSLVMIVVMEIVYILFRNLITLRTKIFEQGQIIKEMGEYLTQVHEKEDYGVVVSDINDYVIDANDKFAKLLGREVIGKNLHDLITKSNQELLDFQQDHVHEEASVLSRDGDRHPVLLTTKLLQSVHEPLIFSLVSDVHKHKEIEEMKREMQQQTLHLQKMESLLQMSGDIAHNINNFHSGISGFAQLIKMYKSDPDKVDQYSERLLQEIHRISEYILKMIDITNPIRTTFQPVSLSQALNDAIENVFRFVDKEKYTIEIHTTKQLPNIIGIHRDIVNVLFQVIRNATEAMSEGGTVVIEARSIAYDNEHPPRDGLETGTYVEISISDAGSGVETGIKHLIFDPFFSTKDKVGTGLGLTIAFAIIKYHRGAITFENNLYRGSTFTIHFRATAQELVTSAHSDS